MGTEAILLSTHNICFYGDLTKNYPSVIMKYQTYLSHCTSDKCLLIIEEMGTINFLNIWTPKKFVVITLKFELCGSTIE